MTTCAFCEAEGAQHVCPRCGGPQPIAPSHDFFTLMNAPSTFSQNQAELEKRFYEISRELHPDRFAAGNDRKWKVISVERMSAVNRAYRTLSDPEALRDYLLEKGGVSSPPRVPAELAEEWFELQDAWMDNPSEVMKEVARFEAKLTETRDRLESSIRRLEDRHDVEIDSNRLEILRQISEAASELQYLKSLNRDFDRMKIAQGGHA